MHNIFVVKHRLPNTRQEATRKKLVAVHQSVVEASGSQLFGLEADDPRKGPGTKA